MHVWKCLKKDIPIRYPNNLSEWQHDKEVHLTATATGTTQDNNKNCTKIIFIPKSHIQLPLLKKMQRCTFRIFYWNQHCFKTIFSGITPQKIQLFGSNSAYYACWKKCCEYDPQDAHNHSEALRWEHQDNGLLLCTLN